MVKQVVNIGTVELRGRDGDTNRVANEKFQANHNETYKALGADGEGNLPTALPIENGGTGATTATNARENLDVDSRAETTQKIKDNVVNNLTAGGTENALSAEMGKNLQSNKLDKTANAVSASKLFTARSFTWTGDVTGSVNFDGSANVTNALTLSNTGVAAGAYGSNIKTVTLTLDAKGRVTAASQQDIRAATTALSGVVQLNDTLTSTLITQAATANAVKKVNDAVLATDIIAKAAIPSSQKGMANGVATLDSSGVIPANQLPSYVDDVLEFATQAAFPATGETGKIYISIETSMTYRWTGTVYAPIGGGAGTADTALRLFSPRTIALSGGATGTATQFDGSANIIIPITEVDASKITKGTIPAARIPTLNQSTTGNAATATAATTATKLATPRKINGKDFDGTADIEFDGGGIFIGTPIWVNINRANVYDGFIASDGQLLNRADFPDLWAAVAANTYAKVTEAAWIADPLVRASYTEGNGTTTFRVPDLNGIQSGSLKGLYARGDGYNNSSGSILSDAIRNIKGKFDPNLWGGSYNAVNYDGPFYSTGVNAGLREASGSTNGSFVFFDASLVVPTANENRPVSAVGVWLIRARGATMPMPAEGSPATLLANNFNGSQGITGDLTVTGSVNANLLPNVKTALNASGNTPIYACRAWVNFNGTGIPSIRGSGNISSITDNGAGDYTINFSTPLPDENYAVSFGHTSGAGGSASLLVRSETGEGLSTLKTASALRIIYKGVSSSTLYDVADANVVIFR